MSQHAQNQSVTKQSAVPISNQPGPGAAAPDRLDEDAAMTRLAETASRLLRSLNHPHARRTSPLRRHGRLGSVSTVSQAKNYLRATRPRSSKFRRSAPDLQRHRRKCVICHHPERDMIEELFIHWHNPWEIAEQFDNDDTINRVSIYRHAYALGLDKIRRRNLSCVFETILDSASDAPPTAAGVIAAARALALCVSEDGRWVEPPKSVIVTTFLRKEDPATTSTAPSSAPETKERAQYPSSRERTEGRGSPSTPLQASSGRRSSTRESASAHSSTLPPARRDQQAVRHQPARTAVRLARVTAHESRDVPSSSLPEAAFNPPAAALQTPSSPLGAARKNKSVATSATSLPEAAFNPPAAALQTPPPGFPAAVLPGTREIRRPPNSHKTKNK
jgi:hypothetical protein